VKCIVETCEREQERDGLCMQHWRRNADDRLIYENGALYDTCANGHLWTAENTRWEASGVGGRRRRCRMCGKDKQLRKAARDAEVVETPPPYIPDSEAMRQAVVRFERAISEIDPKCKGQEDVYRDWELKDAPTQSEARELCAGCPLLKMCGNYAASMRPGWGIWGGVTWVYGKPLTRQQRALLVEQERIEEYSG
jgi:hypothetical protein